ncbi:MAG: hypothetical protein ACREM6_14825 [Vulcanimicrobiaceae bacterium]
MVPMRRPIGSAVLPALAWLLASFATAALAHGLIGWLGQNSGGNSFDEHAHETVGPIVLAVISVFVSLLLRVATRAAGRSPGTDPVVVLAHRFRDMRPILPSVAVAFGGFATLIAMEFTEQLSAFGHIVGVADALGGDAPVGLAIIIGVALLVTIAGLRSARVLVDATITAVGAFASWVIVAIAGPLTSRAAMMRQSQHRRHASTSAFHARSLGLRAPPSATV